MKRFVLFCILVARGLGADANLEPAGWPLAAHFPNLPTVKQSPPSKDARFIGRAVAAKEGARRVEFREVMLLIDGQVETYQFMHDYSPSGKNLFDGKEFFASAAKQSETARP